MNEYVLATITTMSVAVIKEVIKKLLLTIPNSKQP